MSGRIFQSVVLQIKENSGQSIGVIDSDGTVISCSDLSSIGTKWPQAVQFINIADGQCVTIEG